MKIFLFDIDGTIMLSGGAGMRSMTKAFAMRHGVENAFKDFHFQGKVDPAIFREALQLHGIETHDEDDAIRELVKLYEELIAKEMPHSHQAKLYPGVREILEALHGRNDVSVGLLTGNVIGGARAKLSYFDLWKYFPYGAFGSDHEHREALVPIALDRATKHLGHPVQAGPDVYIIGDTDRDIACALANHCTAVGVATLGFSVGQLRELGAHIVFPDLSDTATVLRALGVNENG